MGVLIVLALSAVLVVVCVRVLVALLPIFVFVVLPIAAVAYAWAWIGNNPVPALVGAGVLAFFLEMKREDRAMRRRWAEDAAREEARLRELEDAADAAIVDIHSRTRKPAPSTPSI